MKATIKHTITAITLFVSIHSTQLYSETIFYWGTSQNTLKNHLGNNIPQYNATVLTYVSGDAVIDFVFNGIIAPAYGSGAGADVFVGAKRNTVGGRYSTENYYFPHDDYVGKYAYAVILDLPFSSFTDIASIPVGTWYGVSAIGADSSGNPAQLLKYDFQNPGTQVQLRGGTVQTTLQVIPEPAGVAMIVLGAATVAIRRRMKRLMV